MRRAISLALWIVAVLALSDASAQSIVRRSFVLPEIGIAHATGDLAEPINRGGLNVGSGPSGGLSFVRVFSEGFGAGARWRYVRLPVRDLESGSVHVSGHVLDLSAYLMLATKGPVIPFINAGLMLGKSKISGETDDFPYFYSPDRVSGTVSIDWTTGLTVGGGILNPMTDRFGLYLVGEYCHLTTDGSEAEITLESGTINTPRKVVIPLNTDWFTIKAGLMIFLGSGG
jgi:hypothetical protein